MRVRTHGLVAGAAISLLLGAAVTPSAQAAADKAGSAAPAAAPAAVAAVGCTGGFTRGPYWYAGVDASVRAGTRMVADVQGPWTSDGVQAHMWHWYNGQSQKWCLDPTENGSSGGTFYQVRNYYTGKCLDSGATGYGTLVKQQTCNSGTDQRWYITSKGSYSTPDGTQPAYEFRSVANGAGYCLDVREFGYADGALLQTWSCSNGRNQRFY
ncbi:RICIN domain-containing protein [Streptomyces sp. NPDC086077]|uniref:RICIN domain-containing protein n=1 Tax=Streptomyces sp. NPDC086077 TaxID=3154862 RepID=UPI0034439D64